MSIVSNCRNCGAPLNRTSIEAFVPYCDNCGSAFMGVGGTLGITSAFEREDPGLQRHLITNQIATLDEATRKYNGMILHCNEQLELDAAAYATLPTPPPLLETQPVPPLLSRVLGPAAVQGLGLGCPISIVVLVAVFTTATGSPVRTFFAGLPGGDTIFKLYPYSVVLAALVIALINYARRAQVIYAPRRMPGGCKRTKTLRRQHSVKRFP